MIKRIIAGATAAGLLSLTPVAVSAPAHAGGGSWTTTGTAQSSATTVVYGDDIYIRSEFVTGDATGDTWFHGTATLYALEAGSSSWTPVATDDTYGSSTFYDVKPRMTTQYKVVFNDTDADEYVYSATESAPFTVAVQRNVEIKKARKRLTIKGKVRPDYKRSKVIIHRKKGKRWIKHKTVTTNSRSVFQVTLPRAPRGKKLYFRVTVPGSSQYVQFSEVWYTYSY